MEFLAVVAAGFLFVFVMAGVSLMGAGLGVAAASALNASHKVCLLAGTVCAIAFPVLCYIAGRIVTGV